MDTEQFLLFYAQSIIIAINDGKREDAENYIKALYHRASADWGLKFH